MADIYSTSTTTLVWLGERSIDVQEAFDTTKRFRSLFPAALLHNLAPELNTQSFLRYQLEKRDLGHTDNIFHLDLASFLRLLQRLWFKRKWIIQEVVKSKRVVLNIGRESMPWETLGDLATYVTAWSVDRALAQLMFNHSAEDALKNIAMIENIRFGDISSLARLLRFTDRFACTDPRDQIIALLNLASDVNGAAELLPDYTVPAFEIFHRYAKWTALTKRTLEFLSYDFDPSWRKGMPLPSWVPYHDSNGSDSDKVARVPESKFNATKDCDLRISISDNGDTLHVWGKLVDEVSALGERLSDRSEQMQWEPSETGRSDHDRILRANIAKVQEDFKKVLNFKRMAHDQPHGMSSARFEQFWRVLCWELNLAGDRAPPGVGNYVFKMLQIMESSVAEFPQAEDDAKRITAELAAWEPNLVAGFDFAGGRLFCVTARDRLACVPQAAEVGDRICVLYGGRLPFVIRPCDGGRYTYVGNCYLQGIMNGEAVDMKDLEEEEFMLV
jgi:Heterokaryon incompatibility protein (HET)